MEMLSSFFPSTCMLSTLWVKWHCYLVSSLTKHEKFAPVRLVWPSFCKCHHNVQLLSLSSSVFSLAEQICPFNPSMHTAPVKLCVLQLGKQIAGTLIQIAMQFFCTRLNFWVKLKIGFDLEMSPRLFPDLGRNLHLLGINTAKIYKHILHCILQY